jgi:hypothetical protein
MVEPRMCRSIHGRTLYQRQAIPTPIVLTEEYGAVGMQTLSLR